LQNRREPLVVPAAAAAAAAEKGNQTNQIDISQQQQPHAIE
jgi:hypothetical protein